MKAKAIGTAVIAALFFAAAIPPRVRPAEGAVFGVAPEAGPVAKIVSTLQELNITPEQKKQIAGILRLHRDEVRQAVEPLVASRVALFESIHADAYNELEVRQASRQVGRCIEELAVVRARVAGELKAVLTPGQKELLKEKKADAFRDVMARVEAGRGILDNWIESNGG